MDVLAEECGADLHSVWRCGGEGIGWKMLDGASGNCAVSPLTTNCCRDVLIGQPSSTQIPVSIAARQAETSALSARTRKTVSAIALGNEPVCIPM